MEASAVPVLLERLAAGDTNAAWADFLRAYSDHILKPIKRFTTDEDARSDCYVFVCDHLARDACARLRKFEPDGPAQFTTWLYAVVLNLCRDWYRARNTRTPRARTDEPLAARARPRLQLVSLEEIDPQGKSIGSSGPEADPLTNAARVEVIERLARGLEALPDADLLLIRLRFERDLTLAEVARIAGLANAQAADRRIRAIVASLQGVCAVRHAENSADDPCQNLIDHASPLPGDGTA